MTEAIGDGYRRERSAHRPRQSFLAVTEQNRQHTRATVRCAKTRTKPDLLSVTCRQEHCGRKCAPNGCIMFLQPSMEAHAGAVKEAMKPILLLAILFTLASVAIAQKTQDANARHLKAVKPKPPSVSVAPRHETYSAPGLHGTAKPDSADAQLNKLERQTATLGTGKSASKTTPSPTTSAPKTSGASAEKQAINFENQPRKGGTATTKPRQGTNPTKSGVRGRVNGTGHY